MSGMVFDAVSPLLQANDADGDKMDIDGDDPSKSEERCVDQNPRGRNVAATCAVAHG